MIFDHTFLCNTNKRTAGFTFWPNSFASNANNILSSLFFQKKSAFQPSSELKLAISFIESSRTCLEHSRTILDLQICPRDRN